MRETARPDAFVQRGGHLGLAARARAYMLANIDRRISVPDLARQLGVSERTLRYAFRETYGTSPSRYLKTTRLQQARRALENADPLKARARAPTTLASLPRDRRRHVDRSIDEALMET